MNRPEHMRAAFIDALGEAGSIRVGDLPVPEPAATEVLVRMEASEVNHVDLFVRSGAFPHPAALPVRHRP
jgi:NADPH:quinone reductase-like Zn-dependent oxidoreductase